MRLQKEISAWFPFPDDPDKSEFKFKLLNPGEVSRVQDAGFDMTVEFKEDGQGKRLGRPKTTAGREEEVKLSTKSFKNVFDADGSEIECNPGTKLRPLREFPGFYDFFQDCQGKLLKIKKDQEKNLPGTSKGSKKSQGAEPAKD